jgi:hypothetical protein
MKQPVITIESHASGSFGVRLAIQMISTVLYPLKPNDRMTVLMTMLADEILMEAESDAEIDAIVNMLRLKLQMMLTDAPPLQGG